ncbi:molybdenum cofactor biosynthesis protein MoaE [Helicobacter sp. 13S00477-4]|uniref:molybdopterin synthase catalytic subunit n=1 Tax=Helicobacter sp. 13S00477-4 TaxID=1905759 RepID=UPI000BA67B1E|nr:molybdenum cofactor biosynthesis protein MoaE [Helicobacter sp. 13S00477-4]PAF51539.1 molybdenum cofactor biosynthesis protein MoaE [Helicobacter sp. 13S00477-4]
MLEIYEGPLPVFELYKRWEGEAIEKNLGAFCLFEGIVREEGDIEGLSFDIYEPLFLKWFEVWEQKAKDQKVFLRMAHSKGNVAKFQSSYMVALMSAHRKAALSLYEDFINDFKHSAPIWKYDIKNNERIYAKDRSFVLKGSGILS